MLNATRANATLATSANATQKTTRTRKINTLASTFTSSSYAAPSAYFCALSSVVSAEKFSFLIYQAISLTFLLLLLESFYFCQASPSPSSSSSSLILLKLRPFSAAFLDWLTAVESFYFWHSAVSQEI